MEGKIKFVNRNKGFGFIVDEDGNDIFFHVNQFINAAESTDLFKDDRVEFDVGSSPKGTLAINIKLM